jgi:GT2 family glycosyltransferase/4-amino-4-deoxy-L-arabinose transferase-like glycosyltransferase
MISILIVNYKVKEKLFRCIKSIYDSKPKTEFEIIVVDNDNESEIGNSLKKTFPKVVFIKSQKNLGYGGGNNLGAQSAKGEYLFIINPDTLVFKNTVDEIVSFFEKNKNVGIVSPMLVDKNSKPFHLQGTSELTPLRGIVCLSFIERILPKNSISRKYWLKDWNHTKLREVEVCPGTAFMISRNLFEQINGFDENFFLYFEEDDISKRVKELGYKIYILEKAKIFHEVGASTKQLDNSAKVFAKSRFAYFKKHYGILNALLVELFLGVNKVSLFMAFVLGLALLLRIYNLANGMTFIGDQGWFYVSARDLLVYGKIPLVGITSSHTWLHQGPLWTYMLSIVFLLSKFNPLSGGYLTVILGVLTTFLMFRLGKDMFSQKIGLIAAILYATSPLVVSFDRMPFDPSPIPLFTVLYLYSLVKWIKGNVNYFPVILLLLAILYNLELATFTLVFPLVLIFIYGCFKKRNWVLKLFNKKILLFSFVLPILIMLPVIVYDFSNGFKQTVVFLGWTLYKPFSFLINHSSGNISLSLKTVLDFCLLNLQRLVFQENLWVSLLLFVVGICLLFFQVFKKRKIDEPKSILLFLLVIGILGIIVNQSPSEAYLPIVLPFIIFTIAILFAYLSKVKFLNYVSMLILIVVLSSNIYSILNNDSSTEFRDRLNAVKQIIKLADNQAYNLVGRGEGSQFESFTMNYQYLLWWEGKSPSKANAKTKIVVWENSKGIIIYKQK